MIETSSVPLSLSAAIFVNFSKMFGNDCLAFGILKKNPWKILGKPPKSGHYYVYFSNLLIIHQAKTKEITTLKEVWILGLNQHRFWRFYFSVYSLVFVSIEKIYQTLVIVFHRLSKHLEFRRKYSPARRIFNSLLGVWISLWITVSRVWYTTS